MGYNRRRDGQKYRKSKSKVSECIQYLLLFACEGYYIQGGLEVQFLSTC